MKTNTYFWWYLAQFFLEWEMFQTKVVEKIKPHILCSVTFIFRRSCRLWDSVRKYCRAGQTIIDNMAHAFWIPKAVITHSEYVILIAFPLQQWLHERASMLRLVEKKSKFVLVCIKGLRQFYSSARKMTACSGWYLNRNALYGCPPALTIFSAPPAALHIHQVWKVS